MTFLNTAYRKVRGAFLRAYTFTTAALSVFWGRFFCALFNTRPGLKRGVLVFVLFGLVALPAHLFLGGAALVASLIWAFALFALFLGMGAERAAIEWSPVFVLPPLDAFVFWQWHALEKKRFLAVLCALALGACGALAVKVLS